MSLNIVGLDPSLTAAGIATEAGPEVLAPGKRRGCERLAWLRQEVLRRVQPIPLGRNAPSADLVVLEGYSYASANQAHQVGELGGVIRLALWEAGVPFVTVAPTALKKYATGHGNAPKGEVLAAAIRRLGYEGHSDDEADAMWLRAMGLDAYGAASVVPAAHRGVLARIEWPELGAAAA